MFPCTSLHPVTSDSLVSFPVLKEFHMPALTEPSLPAEHLRFAKHFDKHNKAVLLWVDN